MQRAPTLIAALMTACTGSAPPEPPDAPLDVASEPVRSELHGLTLDLFSLPHLGVGTVEVAFEGTSAVAESDSVGQFEVDLPPGSVVYPIARRTGFRPTRNPAVLAIEGSIARDAYVVAEVELRSMSLAVSGIGLAAGTAVVFADLRRFGEPITGEPLSGIRLVNDSGVVVSARGPFVLDAAGQVDLAAAETVSAFDGRAVVGWLDCPVGTWRIAISSELLQQNVICDAGGATIVDTTTPGEPILPPAPTFSTDIFPTLGRPSIDPRGLACTACHNQLAVAGQMVPIAFDGFPSAAYSAMLLRATEQVPGEKIVDLETPEQSLLLRRPLYEAPPATQDHPNATLIDTRTFEYRLILRWLRQGARE